MAEPKQNGHDDGQEVDALILGLVKGVEQPTEECTHGMCSERALFYASIGVVLSETDPQEGHVADLPMCLEHAVGLIRFAGEKWDSFYGKVA